MRFALQVFELVALVLAGVISGYLAVTALFANPDGISIENFLAVPILGSLSFSSAGVAIPPIVFLLARFAMRQFALRLVVILVMLLEAPAIWGHSNVNWAFLAEFIAPLPGEMSAPLLVASTIASAVLLYLAANAFNLQRADQDLQRRGVEDDARSKYLIGQSAGAAATVLAAMMVTGAISAVAWSISLTGGFVSHVPWTIFVVGLFSVMVFAAVLRYLKNPSDWRKAG